MNWKAILNPWGEAQRLRERITYLEGQLDQVEQWAEDTEGRIYRSMAEHYWQRNRMVEAQNSHMMKQMADVSSLALSPFMVRVMKGAGMAIDTNDAQYSAEG
jgi:hypothetical protein